MKASFESLIATGASGGRSFRSSKYAKKREDLRNNLFPRSADQIWDRKKSKGFTSLPRTIPLIMLLIKKLVDGKGGNPAMAYLDLWCRNMDEGIVTIRDPSDHAYAAGYMSSRGERTWRDHINKLEHRGFIRVVRAGNKEVAHILLLNPYNVISNMQQAAKLPDEWWAAFVSYANEIGAEIPRHQKVKSK